MSCLKKYRKVKYLGKGSYGAAILVELRSNPSQMFVIKEIVIGHLKMSEQNAAKMEAEVLHQMSHSNITMYIESFVENSKLYIVMEHADGGDLTGAIAKRRKSGVRWPEDEVMRIFVQLCLALKHVHEANILHRDLKAQNVFLTSRGIVKLGDFGIAKVLDSGEDQARTQIGTPYYLSPEICESKPYGRKSDVWSLGVILFELLTLEMPFQATSLPSLVHLICATEPPYHKVQAPCNNSVERYSNGMLALVRSMLQKDPDRRPSVKQLVTIDIMRIHISRLLSYTLKAGNGGVGDIRQLNNDSVIDSEEADRNIERARVEERHRANEKAEKDAVLRKAKEREAHRIEEREKLKKFRSEMVRKKENNRKIGDGEDDEVRVLSMPEVASNLIIQSSPSRATAQHRQSNQSSPMHQQQYLQQQQQPQQQQQQQQYRYNDVSRKSDTGHRYDQDYGNQSRDGDWRYLPSGDRDRERERERDRDREQDWGVRERCNMYHREDEIRRNKLSECYDRDYRRVRELSQGDEGRHSSSYNNDNKSNQHKYYNSNYNNNSNNNNYNDNYDGRKGSAYGKGDGYPSHIGRIEGNGRLSHQEQVAQHRAALYQLRREERESGGRGNTTRQDGMHSADVLSNRQGLDAPCVHMLNPVSKGYRPDTGAEYAESRGVSEEIESDIRGYVEYESAARMEFFANRAAALAVKARIDENDSRGMDGLAHFGANVSPFSKASVAGDVGAVRGVERESEWDRDRDRDRERERERESKEQSAMQYLRDAQTRAQAGAAAAASKEEQEKVLQLAREKEIRDTDDPAVRVALIKAQKERDREKLAAEQSYQLQLAHEAQREERRRAADRRFEREREEREEREGIEERDRREEQEEREAKVEREERVEKEERVGSEEKEGGVGREEKGGISDTCNSAQDKAQAHAHTQAESVVPDVAGAVAFSIDFSDVAMPKRRSVKTVENASETDSKAHPRLRKGWGPPADLPINISTISRCSTGSPTGGSCSFERGMSNDQSESESTMDESLVLKRLEERKEQHQKAREQAKEVFRKLREQRLLQVSAGKLPPGSCMVRKKKLPSPTTSSSTSTSTSNSTSHSSTRISKNKADIEIDSTTVSITHKSVARSERLKDILGHVARAVESVDLAVDAGVALRGRKNTPECKDVVAVVEESEELSLLEEDELTNTIDRWLDRCLGNITVRGERRRNREKHVKTAAENCKEGEEQYLRECEQRVSRKLEANSDVDVVNILSSGDDTHSTHSSAHRDADTHDDEMAGLQFMLAKELMSMGITEGDAGADA